jgi:phosphonate transport system substrate-binding protein
MHAADVQRLLGQTVLLLSRLRVQRIAHPGWVPRRLISVALYGMLAFTLITDANARPTDTPLIFGVFPNMTARQTLEIYQPLASLLEKRLQRRVAIYSARDFKTFVERTRQGDYDILLTAPHLAWLARQDAGYRPLLKYAQPTRGLLVVKNTSPYRVPEDLRGQNIATPDSIAVATLAVEADMAAHGLRRNVDYRTTDYGSHLNSVMQVVNGRTAAAMLGLHPFMLLPADLRQQLRVLIETAPLSSLMYLTHPRLRDQEANAIRSALLDFASTPEGKAFMQHGGYGGFVAVDGSELRAFRPYALQAEEMMRVTH